MSKSTIFLISLAVFAVECWTTRHTTIRCHRQRIGFTWCIQAKKQTPKVDDVMTTNDEAEDAVPTDEKKKKKSTNKTRTKIKDELSHYWLNETDSVNFELRDGKVSSLRFQIRGNPRPLVRHRTALGRTYNPSSNLQTSFQSAVFKILEEHDEYRVPFFQEDDQLSMKVIFRMKRAKGHFLRGIPGPGRLKEDAPKATTIRNDIDNLAKFVLDSMNKILYPDDRQITSIQLVKMYDTEDPYSGSTEVYVGVIMHDDDMETIMPRSFNITQP